MSPARGLQPSSGGGSEKESQGGEGAVGRWDPEHGADPGLTPPA